MLKKTVSFLTVLCMALGTGSLVFASGDDSATAQSSQNSTTAPGAQSASADANTVNINGANTININTTDMTGGAEVQTIDGTRADGTTQIDNTTANVLENASKYNAMQANPPEDNLAPSRYSNARISLAPDLSGTKYEEAAELLGALGIMVGDAESGNFRPNDSILRSEMAKVAVYAVGLEDVAKSASQATRFPDVVSDHWANGPINIADQQGMVIGDDVGTFRPDDNVSFEEAVTMIVRALGYEPAAASNGGYPAGYMVVASSKQLLKGINAASSSPATRGDVAQLVFNAMTVNMMEQVGYGSDVSYEEVDKTLLYDKLNVEKGYGQIKGTSETMLTGGSTLARDRIKINDELYYMGDTRAKQLLGYNVIFYARIDTSTDEKTLIVVREQPNKNNSLTIAASDIVDVTGDENSTKTVSYWRNDTDRDPKNVTIEKDPIYIYNGKYKESVTVDDLQPTAGNLVLLDTDSNGNYDIVFVNHFKNIVVDTVSTVTGRVTDKYLNGSLVFDPENTNVEYTLLKNGVEIQVGDLREWNVLSYTISDDNELIKAYVSDKSVTGTIVEVNEKGFRISDDRNLYKKAESYPNELALRDKGTFYMDVEDNIAAFNSRGTDQTLSGESYAYLINAAEEGTFDTDAKFKLFTSKGETKIITSATKMRFNDDYGLEPTEVLKRLQTNDTVTPQLITYETNSSGLITGISVAEDNTAEGTPNIDKFTLNIKQSGMVYKSASGKLDRVAVTEDTIVFDIPATADNDPTRFAVRGKSMFSNDTQYDALIYDMQENYAAKAIVITSSTGITSAESPIVLVDSVGETQNENFDYVDRLYGYEGGKEVEIDASDRNILVKGDNNKKLEQGDIIQYKTNAKGEIDGLTLLFDVNTQNTEIITELSTDLTTVYGRVTKKFEGSVNIEVNGEIHNYALPSDITVYMYDSTRANNNISVVSAADIEIYEEGNEVRLFLKIYKDKVEEAVIVR